MGSQRRRKKQGQKRRRIKLHAIPAALGAGPSSDWDKDQLDGDRRPPYHQENGRAKAGQTGQTGQADGGQAPEAATTVADKGPPGRTARGTKGPAKRQGTSLFGNHLVLLGDEQEARVIVTSSEEGVWLMMFDAEGRQR